MTSDETPGGRSAAAALPGVLDRLIAPTTRDDFAARIWGRLPLLAPASGSGRAATVARSGTQVSAPADHGISELFSTAAVDELLTRRGLRAPFVRMAKQGRTLADADFTSGGGVGAAIRDQVSDDRVRSRFAAGATIVLQGLHRTWAPIIDFSQSLAVDLGHPVQVNAYVTPPGNQGFSAHYDVHDVFVLQIHGTKAWRVHAPVWADPLRTQPWDERRDAVAEAASQTPLIDDEVRAGDVLYLPRGYIHSAAAPADAGVSIHLTVGVHTWTRAHLVDAALDEVRRELARQPELRSSLPLGVDVQDPRSLESDAAAVRRAITLAAGQVGERALSQALFATARSSQRAAPLSVLGQVVDAGSIRPESRLTLRPHLLATLEHDSASGEDTDTVAVRSRAGRSTFDGDCAPALRRLLDGEPIAADDLLPGDPGRAVDSARRLLIDGIAVLAQDDSP